MCIYIHKYIYAKPLYYSVTSDIIETMCSIYSLSTMKCIHHTRLQISIHKHGFGHF